MIKSLLISVFLQLPSAPVTPQSPVSGGVILSNGSVIASSKSASALTQCTFNKVGAGVTIMCTGNGVIMLTLTETPAKPSLQDNGLSGAFTYSGNSITWNLTQPGSAINYNIVAAGIQKNGSF